MDYRIRDDHKALGSTAFMEIGPGKYSGKHWQDGFVFVWEDAFGMAEGLIVRHFGTYDHFGMNDIPREIGMLIIADWEQCAQSLPNLTPKQAQLALNLNESFRKNLESEVAIRGTEVAHMLKELAKACKGFYLNEDFICILGM